MSEQPTISDLQGEWKIVSVGRNGGKAPFFIPWIARLRFVIEGDTYAKYMGKRLIETGTLKVEPDSSYSTFDEYMESDEGEDKVQLGIIRWVGKNIEHLQGETGDERPAGFPYTESSKVGYAMMKRKR